MGSFGCNPFCMVATRLTAMVNLFERILLVSLKALSTAASGVANSGSADSVGAWGRGAAVSGGDEVCCRGGGLCCGRCAVGALKTSLKILLRAGPPCASVLAPTQTSI